MCTSTAPTGTGTVDPKTKCLFRASLRHRRSVVEVEHVVLDALGVSKRALGLKQRAALATHQHVGRHEDRREIKLHSARVRLNLQPES